MSLVSGTNYSKTVVGGARNAIINGNFDIWQRGTSFAAIAGNAYSADRFQYEKNGAMIHTVSRSTDVPTYAESGVLSNYSYLADVTTVDTSIAAGDHCFIEYTLEGYDYARIAGGDATLSFWVKAAKTGIHCVGLRNSVADRSYISEYTIIAADTWEKKIITVPLTETGGTWNYTTGRGLQIVFMLAVGTTFQTTKDAWQTGNFLGTANHVNEVDNVANNFRIAQVQLEKGEAATPFEFRAFSDELGKCQRYYESGTRHIVHPGMVNGTTTTAGTISVKFNTPKRATPTISYATLNTTTTGTFQLDDENGFEVINLTADGSSSIARINSWSADAEL